MMNKPRLLKFSLIASVWGLGAYRVVAQPALTIPTQVPASLQVPTDQKLILKAVGRGAQIYRCQAVANNSNKYQWILKAPDAQLLSDQGQQLGRHYAGPTWSADDGSKVIGQVKAKVDSPQANAIPWLLLQARSHEQQGIFSQVNWIQRLHTVGGKAPTSGCDQVHQNLEARVSYTADYYFYSNKSAGSTSN